MRLLFAPLLCLVIPAQSMGQTTLTNQPLPAASLLRSGFDTAGIKASIRISQAGANNQIRVIQEGQANSVELAQQGDRNAMTVRQSGGDNHLSWRQIGSDLPDLRVAQSGAMSLSIVQTAPAR